MAKVIYGKMDCLGNTEDVEVNENICEILGITDKDCVTPIILADKIQKNNVENTDKILSEDVIIFNDEGIIPSEPLEKGWISFIFDENSVIKA